MAIAAYPATIKSGSTVINDIMTYELPLKMDLVETTAFSGSGGAAIGVKTFVPTLTGTQIKASGSWNAAIGTGDTGQLALQTAFLGRSTVSLVLSPNGTNTYTVTCYISDMAIKADVKGVVTVDFTLQTTGALVAA